jgi:hypothetical protein
MKPEILRGQGWLTPMLLLKFDTPDGRKLSLCDFGSAGSGGSPYRSWLKVDHVKSSPFSREEPLRTAR